jgi:hypothetical protein
MTTRASFAQELGWDEPSKTKCPEQGRFISMNNHHLIVSLSGAGSKEDSGRRRDRLLTDSSPMNDTGVDLFLSVVSAPYAGTLRARGLKSKAFPGLLKGSFSLVPGGRRRENRLKKI